MRIALDDQRCGARGAGWQPRIEQFRQDRRHRACIAAEQRCGNLGVDDMHHADPRGIAPDEQQRPVQRRLRASGEVCGQQEVLDHGVPPFMRHHWRPGCRKGSMCQ